MQKNELLRKLVFSGILIAIYIVLAKVFTFSTPYAKVNLSFLPIALSAMLFGPWWSMGTAAAADIIGTCFFEGGYYPMFTIDAILYALFYAVFLYKKEKTCHPANRACKHPAYATLDLYDEPVVHAISYDFGDKERGVRD